MMKFVRNVGVATQVAALTVVGVAALAYARPAAAAERQAPPAHGGGWGGLCGQTGLEAAAKALGMTADELSTQLWGGSSLADLADKAGVDLQTVRDAVDEACEAAIREAIEQAVADGTITREHADWLLQGLEKGFWGGKGGFGFGRHGFGGFGRFYGRPWFNHSVPPTSTSGGNT